MGTDSVDNNSHKRVLGSQNKENFDYFRECIWQFLKCNLSLHTVMFFPKAKFLGKISNSQDRIVLHISFRSDEGLSIESSALKLFMVANLHY